MVGVWGLVIGILNIGFWFKYAKSFSNFSSCLDSSGDSVGSYFSYFEKVRPDAIFYRQRFFCGSKCFARGFKQTNFSAQRRSRSFARQMGFDQIILNLKFKINRYEKLLLNFSKQKTPLTCTHRALDKWRLLLV